MKYGKDGKRILECVLCGAELTGGIDTFGPLGLESCAACWSEYGISGPYDPWEQLNEAHGPGDTQYLDEAAKSVDVMLPQSRPLRGE